MLDLTLSRPLTQRRPRLRWWALWQSRRALSHLDAHLLRDVGLTEAQADAEARRSIWDAPEAWRVR